MGLIAPQNEAHVWIDLINEYFRGRRNVPGSTKVQQAKEDGRLSGYRSGLAEAMAQFLSLERRQMYPFVQFPDALLESDVRQLLDPKCELYDDLRRQSSSDEGRLDFEKFMEETYLEVRDLAVNELMASVNETTRREKILDGEIDPTEDDREWLLELREKQAEKIKQLEALSRKVGMKTKEKVNDA